MFSESNTIPIPVAGDDGRNKTRKVDGKKGGRVGRRISDEEKLMKKSIESKNKALEFSIYCETSANLSTRLRELKSTKRKLVREFAECSSDKKCGKNGVKARLRLYRHHKEVKAKEGLDSDDSDEESFFESQETLMEELFDLDRDIKSTKEDLKTSEVNKKNAIVLGDVTNTVNTQ